MSTDAVSADTWHDYARSQLHPVLEGALHCFTLHGYHGTTIRMIAAASRLSVAGVYHHYPSKHAILVAVMSQAMEDLWQRSIAADAAAQGGPVDRFVNIVTCLLEFHTQRRDEAFIALTEIRSLEANARADHIAKRDRQQRLVESVVEDGVAAGAFTTEHPRDASRAVVTMCTSVSDWYRPDGALSSSELAARYCGIALGAVGGHTQTGGPVSA
ncbi:TetR/AcrR family transcriptional regulator [Brevibacterium jeotgali]|uniref:Transcriptional regulator, TetR family n=1 Tax=Brevibacterium jeotgali TaxID=1262550 RepID=A0A2H1L5Y5_9MICO|nr:TetR/AcrR family transcriptional regulator [Brevibacterium jeotgali]TWB98616.1 TetR family transcriptional regulator [Brevibacterium jeotgali]SMY11783.1 transcriptional regulator, TetR family [Brevibacterium jeotgali]